MAAALMRIKKRDKYKISNEAYVDDLAELILENKHCFFIIDGKLRLLDFCSFFDEKFRIKELTLFTFGIGPVDIDILDDFNFKINIVIDKSFRNRCPNYFNKLIKLYPDTKECLNHMKIVLIDADFGKIVIRGSMNLNKNIRLEQLDCDIDNKLYDYIYDQFLKIKKTPHLAAFFEDQNDECGWDF